MFHVKPTDDTHAMDPAVIAAALEASGVSISREQAQLIAAHADLVLATNVTMNLTRITSPDAVVTLHIVDSLAFLPRIAPLIGPVVDIGSGAGYPGIPLRIAGVDVA